MTYGELTRAMKAAQKLSGMDMPARDAYRVFKLNQSLDSIRAFCWERERGMLEKHGGTLEQDGTIRFIHGDSEADQREGGANMEAFIREIDAFHDTEAEADIAPVTLRLDALDGQKITPADIAVLDGLVAFE